MPEVAVSISKAKAVVSAVFPKACDASHHIHAGIGTDPEFGLTQYTKRARTLQRYLGNTIFHRSRMANMLKR